MVYTAPDGKTALHRAENVPPHVILSDSADQFLETIFEKKPFASTSVILTSALPEKELFMDELVTGRLSFWDESSGEDELNRLVTKALNFAFHGKHLTY